jgi:hypothetical protein
MPQTFDPGYVGDPFLTLCDQAPARSMKLIGGKHGGAVCTATSTGQARPMDCHLAILYAAVLGWLDCTGV